MSERLLRIQIAARARDEALLHAASVARRLTDDVTRRALGGNAVLVASQIEQAILALRARATTTHPQETGDGE